MIVEASSGREISQRQNTHYPLSKIIVSIIVSGFFMFLLAAVSSELRAEEAAMEELGFMEIEDVFAAAKHLQTLEEAPASITIVTDEEIEKYGHRTISDVVKNVRSFYTYSDRNYDYIGVRGFARLGDYGNRVLQLVDGHTYNDNIYGTFFMGHDFGIDMDLVRKIEFVRGPGSALYGSNALLGTVNLITKKGQDIDGVNVKAEGGSFNTYAGGVTFGKEYGNGLDIIAAFHFMNSGGQDHYYPEFAGSSGGWARDADGEKARKFFLKATYNEFSFKANFSWREKNVPTASFGTIFNDNRFRTIDERDFAELRWDHALDNKRKLTARVYYDRYYYEGNFPYDYPPPTLNKDEVFGQWIGADMLYDHAFTDNRLTVGGESAYHFDAHQKNFDVDPQASYLDDKQSFTTWSLFAQDEWDIRKWVRLVAGLRYDHYSTFGEHLSPRAGLILRPAEKSTIKLLYGEAFRAPNVYELYYQTSTGSSVYRSNPNLKPEIMRTYEIVGEQELTKNMKATASIFRYEIKDLIVQQTLPDSSLQFQNVNRVKSDGFEVGIEAGWPDLLKGHLSYTRQETEDVDTGAWLANSPRHMIKAGVMIPLYKDIVFLGPQGRYVSRRLDRDGETVGASFITDMTLSVLNPVGGLKLSLGIYNLSDESYADPVSADHTQKQIGQDGRNYWLKATYNF